MLATDIDAELWLITCALGSARWPDGPHPSGVAQGFNLIPVSAVREAVGGVSEAVGDEKIGGEGTFNKDMSNDGMIFRHTNKLSSLEPKVLTSGARRRAQRENVRVCAYGEWLSLLFPSRSCQLLLSGRETVRKNKKSEKCSRHRMESGFR